MLSGDVISEVGGGVRWEMIGENKRVVRKVVMEEIMGALRKMKRGMTSIVV